MKKALVVVSFGTTYPDTLKKTIAAIERDLAEAFPDRELRRAFTSGFVRKKIEFRDNVRIDGVLEALEALHLEGYEDVLVQPTHLINGEETERMMKEVAIFDGYFNHLAVGRPLLTDHQDYERLADAVMSEMPELDENEAIVFMGHGTMHHANPAYAAFEYVLHAKGYHQSYVGTVEGYPTIQEVIQKLDKTLSVRTVYTVPLLIVAGEHATKDMNGNDLKSWKNQLILHHYKPIPVMKGLGEYESVRAIFVDHANRALERKA